MIARICMTALALAASLAAPASAQTWPGKPVRIIVPFAPGGTTDVQARLFAKKYAETLGQAFLVENRAGASGMIGSEAAARAAADGYTILYTSASLSVNASLYAAKSKFDPLKDLAPVTLASSVPLVLTLHPSVPVKSLKELVALSRRQKGGLNGGHNGNGTTSHLALEMLRQQTGAHIVPIPYKGGGPTTTAIVGGEVDCAFSAATTVKAHVDSGRLRALAVTSRKPASAFPKLPTLDSLIPGFEADNWFAMFVPAGTPKDIVTKLHGLATEALKASEMREFIARDGGDVIASTPEELGAHLRGEIARYAKVIKAGNIKSD